MMTAKTFLYFFLQNWKYLEFMYVMGQCKEFITEKLLLGLNPQFTSCGENFENSD